MRVREAVERAKVGLLFCGCCGAKVDYETLRLVNNYALGNLIRLNLEPSIECERCYCSECPDCAIFEVVDGVVQKPC